MDDTRRGLNLVSTTVANIRNDILNLAGSIQNQLLPQVRSVVAEFQKIHGLMGGLTPSQMRGAVPLGGTNKVADNGVPTAGGDGAGGGDKKVSAGASDGGNRFTRTVGALGGGFATANLVANALPNVSTAVRQDLLTAQSAFYGQGGFGGTLQQQTGNVRALQNQLARMGIATNAMDTTEALARAQNLGLSGASNFNQVMQGAAVASNFAPGIGVSGAVQATGTINAPQTVNMLRTVGINVRGPNGQVLPIPQVVDQIWNMITRQLGNTKLSEQDIQIGLMPGNGLYGMMTSLFGNDQMTYTLVSNMLLAKARSGGGMNLSTTNRSDLQKMGLTTATVNKMAARTAGETKLLTTVASAEAAGFGLSADLGNALNNFAAAAGPLTQALAAASGGYTGFMGLGNGTVGSVVKTGMGVAAGQAIVAGAKSLLPKLLMMLPLLALEKGGPADAQTPYIVGEKGPELFVPKSDGVVIPNNMLNSPFREGGGGVTAGGMKISNQTDFAKALLSGLGAKPTKEAISNVLMWQQLEGGNWGNTAKFNPLNTSLQLSGSVNYNSLLSQSNKNYKSPGASGVQAYQSWEQGVAATIQTLTGKDADKRGYTDIVNTLIGGGTTKADFLKLLQASSWDAGRYKGGTSTSTSSTSTSSKSAVSTTSSASSSLSKGASSTDYDTKIQSVLASAAGATASTGSTTYNNGPIHINVSGASDTKSIIEQLKKEFANNNIITQAGNS